MTDVPFWRVWAAISPSHFAAGWRSSNAMLPISEMFSFMIWIGFNFNYGTKSSWFKILMQQVLLSTNMNMSSVIIQNNNLKRHI